MLLKLCVKQFKEDLFKIMLKFLGKPQIVMNIILIKDTKVQMLRA